MARNRQPGLGTFGSVLLSRLERSLFASSKDRGVGLTPGAGATNCGAVYIGLGDPFDDDRRRVRSRLADFACLVPRS